MGDLDPTCPELRSLKAFHAGQQRLLAGPALSEAVRRKQAEDLRRHALACERCFENARLPTHCAGCGGPLFREGERLVCRTRFHALRSCFRGHRGTARSIPIERGARPVRPIAVEPPPKTPAPTATRVAPPPHRPEPARKEPSHAARPSGAARASNAKRPKARAADPAARALESLGLGAAAEAEDIRRAYREQAHFFHPDKAMRLSKAAREAAEARMKELNKAYETLKRVGRA